MNTYYTSKLEGCNGDPRKTWQFLNKELGRCNRGIKDILTENGTVLTQDEDKA